MDAHLKRATMNTLQQHHASRVSSKSCRETTPRLFKQITSPSPSVVFFVYLCVCRSRLSRRATWSSRRDQRATVAKKAVSSTSETVKEKRVAHRETFTNLLLLSFPPDSMQHEWSPTSIAHHEDSQNIPRTFSERRRKPWETKPNHILECLRRIWLG